MLDSRYHSGVSGRPSCACLGARSSRTGVTLLGAVLPAPEPGAAPIRPFGSGRRPQAMTAGLAPITRGEHESRILRARPSSGRPVSTLWCWPRAAASSTSPGRLGLSERFFGMVLPARRAGLVTPAFERERASSRSRSGRRQALEEHESPTPSSHRRCAPQSHGRIAIEEAMPFAFAEGLARRCRSAAGGGRRHRGCECKDATRWPHRRACEITVRAHRAVFASIREGMTRRGRGLSREATSGSDRRRVAGPLRPRRRLSPWHAQARSCARATWR